MNGFVEQESVVEDFMLNKRFKGSEERIYRETLVRLYLSTLKDSLSQVREKPASLLMGSPWAYGPGVITGSEVLAFTVREFLSLFREAPSFFKTVWDGPEYGYLDLESYPSARVYLNGERLSIAGVEISTPVTLIVSPGMYEMRLESSLLGGAPVFCAASVTVAANQTQKLKCDKKSWTYRSGKVIYPFHCRSRKFIFLARTCGNEEWLERIRSGRPLPRSLAAMATVWDSA